MTRTTFNDCTVEENRTDGFVLTDNKIDKLRERFRRRTRRAERKANKPRCEVITCGSKGPHRCPEVGCCFLQNGRRVCHHHFREQYHAIAFTEEDAIRLHRERHNQNRLLIDGGAE